MKNPGEKIGNDVWYDLPKEAVDIILSIPRLADEIFPYTTDAIGAAFTKACKLLGFNSDELPRARSRQDGADAAGVYVARDARDSRASGDRWDKMAVAAALYVHPKLANMQPTGRGGGPIQTVDLTKLSGDELAQLEAIFGPLAGAAGDYAEDDPAGEGKAAGS